MPEAVPAQTPAPVLTVHPPLREAQIQPQPGLQHLRYARGFLITRERFDEVPGTHWQHLEVAGRHVAWDRRTPLAHSSCGGTQVLLLGRPVHPRRATADIGDVVRHLSTARAGGRDALARELDHVVGRYLVLDSGPEGTYVQTDAASMRSCYHDDAAAVLASHSLLTTEALGQRRPSAFPLAWLKETRALTYPGRATEWEGVHLLTPNTEICLEDGRIARTGPMPVQQLVSASLAARRLLPHLQRQLTLLADSAPLLISLTAGLDSRTTLALSRPVADRASYFTYRRDDIGEADESAADTRTAALLAGRLGLQHQVVPVAAPPQGPLDEVLAGNIPRAHGRGVAAAYRQHLPADRVHIRSNLYEIGRAVYLRRGFTGELTAAVMSETLMAKANVRPSAAVVEAFEEWIEAVSFAAPEGVDPYDLFYWEHRMSAWLNSHLIESDIAFDTHILVNSRALLRHLLSVSQGQRRWGKVFEQLIALSWPETLDVPVNGKQRKLPEPGAAQQPQDVG